MTYLVDTHIFLWSLFSPRKINKKIRRILRNQEVTKFVSLITFWEISLKYSLGKLPLKKLAPDELPNIAKNARYDILFLDTEVVCSFYKLPKIKNKDPFDRMLAWQAIRSDCTLVTVDKDFRDLSSRGLKLLS